MRRGSAALARRPDSPCLLQIPLPDPGLGTGCPSLAPLPLPALVVGRGARQGTTRSRSLALVWQSVPAPVPRGFGCRASCSGTYGACPPLVCEGTGGSSGNLFFAPWSIPEPTPVSRQERNPCCLVYLFFFEKIGPKRKMTATSWLLEQMMAPRRMIDDAA